MSQIVAQSASLAEWGLATGLSNPDQRPINPSDT